MTVNPRNDPEFGGPSPKKCGSQETWIVEKILVLGAAGILFALLLPSLLIPGDGVPRPIVCKNNLKNIAIALQGYRDRYGAFPPAYTVDADGKPLHSWRTLILPYLDNAPLYEDIDLKKPWDDEVNARFLETPIGIYRCPNLGASGRNKTTYLAITAPDGWAQPGKRRRIEEFTDGLSETLLVIEVDEASAVPWGAPIDADTATILGRGPNPPHGRIHAVFADGSVKSLNPGLSAETLRALSTIAGGEKVKLNSD
ncbi:MAG: DUF1559 domain-containing protein [Isosphaeraceae bacterium]